MDGYESMDFLEGLLGIGNAENMVVLGSKILPSMREATEAKANCASCGSELPFDAAFCPKCGYKKG
jgi:ribosomal protein L40E